MEEKITIGGKAISIVKLLGKGKGCYSYLVSDGTDHYVLKQIHHEPCDYYQFGNKIESELNDHQRLSQIGIRMPELLFADKEKECILKEYIDGDTVYDMVRKDCLPEICMNQIRDMCSLLYPAGTNIDYFPTNFVLQDGLLYYIDYECNDYTEEWDFEHWGIKYWSKTPEFLEYDASH